MKRKDVSLYISYQFYKKGLYDLRGKYTEFCVYRNGTLIEMNISVTKLRKIAMEGDTIEGAIWNNYFFRDFNFIVKNNQDAINKMSLIRSNIYSENRDSQRSKVYKWERLIRNSIKYTDNNSDIYLSNVEIERLYETLCNWYGLPAVTFEVTARKKRYSTYSTGLRRIKLAESWGRNLFVVLHEFAHHLHDYGLWRDGVAHGAEFVSWLIDLYCLVVPEYYPDWTSKKIYSLMLDGLTDYRKIKYSKKVFEVAKANYYFA